MLADTATISANEGSNALLLTDTQANIRRIAMIVHALDTSVSSISTIRVFPLSYADAKSLAEIVTDLFATPENTQTQQQQGGNRRGNGGAARFFGGGGQPQQPAPTQSGALEAAARVVAVADEQSNSLIVSASDDVIKEVGELVAKVDRSTTEITDTRIFRLINADAVETADIINTLYGDGSTNTSSPQQQQGGNGQNRGTTGANGRRTTGANRGGQNIPGIPPQFAALLAGNSRSDRELAQARVVAVGDPRTNSLLVSASKDSLTSIAEMIGRLDATDAKKQHVYVYPLQHADPVSVANVLRGMTGDTTAANSAANATSRLSDRAANGASTEATQSASSTSSTGRSTR